MKESHENVPVNPSFLKNSIKDPASDRWGRLNKIGISNSKILYSSILQKSHATIPLTVKNLHISTQRRF
jgi:hypothetical protein